MNETSITLGRAMFLSLAVLSAPVVGQEAGASSDPSAEPPDGEGILPIQDYSGDWGTRSKLTGDWGGLRQRWADNGVTFDLDWFQAYQDVTDGGRKKGAESATSLDYRMTLDLMRMDVVPGAVLIIRAQ